MRVYRYPIDPRGGVRLPLGATPLSFGLSRDEYVVWALVDPAEERPGREVRTYMTGHEVVPDGASFIGTLNDDGYVLHAFEVQS